LSKTIGLPQAKLGWIAIQGPDAEVIEALDRLELICDTYLSVSTPVQVAAAGLLEKGTAVRDRILERVRHNYAALRDTLAPSGGAAVLPADGGWSAVIRVPATRTEEALVLALLERDRVVVHPGYFFDFPHEAFLVVSLLPRPELFARGLQLIQDRLDAA
jgi:aspartate/methionine/tyrosine aminotransferase